MLDRTAEALGDRKCNVRMRHNASGQDRNPTASSRRAYIFSNVCLARFGEDRPVEEDLVDQLFNSTEKRLARLLLLLANFGKEGRPEPLVAKITQETLAEMVGTTRSRVSHFMNKFRETGFIDYNGHLEVHSSLLSVVLAEQPRTVRSPQ